MDEKLAEVASRDADVVVVGAGPAGRAAAAACAATGLRTTLVDPAPGRPWSPTYGAWLDEVPTDVAATTLARRWRDVRVRTDDGEVAVDRTYVLFDNAALHQHLRDRFAAADGTEVTGRVREVTTSRLTHTVAVGTAGGRSGVVRTRAVVDASGHRPVAVVPGSGGPPPLQTAYGVYGRWTRPPATPGAMTFMDLSGAAVAPPTFLYAMDLGGGRWLAEETSLAAHPAVPLAVLARRLDSRLAGRGAASFTVESVERVAFPMGVAVPDRSQPVVAFGAAAGAVHPSTGFQVARSLRTAPALAAALREAIAAGRDVRDVAAAGWSAVWPADALRQRALQQLGLTALLRMDGRTLQRFFGAFFGLPADEWSAFVSGATDVAALRAVMTGVFARAPWSVRRSLAMAALRRPALLAAGLVPQLSASSR